MKIHEKEIIHRGSVHLTPLCADGSIDVTGSVDIIREEYSRAGSKASEIDAGALIITGESAKLRNAAAIAEALSAYAGNFVVASAGPHLESVLAAEGVRCLCRL